MKNFKTFITEQDDEDGDRSDPDTIMASRKNFQFAKSAIHRGDKKMHSHWLKLAYEKLTGKGLTS